MTRSPPQPCIGFKNHRYGADGVCVRCTVKAIKYEPSREPMDTTAASAKYPRGMNYLALFMGLATCVILAVLPRSSSGDMIILTVDDQPITVEMYSTLPEKFDLAINSGPNKIISRADAYYIEGGFYFPVSSTDYGFAYNVPITPTNLPQMQWSFELWAYDPARWRINEEGTYDPDFFTVGKVIGGFSIISEIANSATVDEFGLRNIPVDAGGNPYLVSQLAYGATETLDAPETATITTILPAILILKRK